MPTPKLGKLSFCWPNKVLISSRIIYKQGTITRVIKVANKMPNPREIAMGIKNLACLDVSVIIGASPPQVVNVVSKIGLNLWMPAEWTA